MKTNQWLAVTLAALVTTGSAIGFSAWAADNAPRFPALTVDEMTPEQKAQMGNNYDPLGFTATLLRNPKVSAALHDFGQAVLVRYDKTRRQPQYLDELAIMMTAKFWRNQPNYRGHEITARKVGASEAAITAVATGKKQPGMKPDEELVFDFATELLDTRAVSDATFKRAVATVGEDGVVNWIGTMGMYVFMSMVINVAQTPKPYPGPVPFEQAR